MLTVIKNPSDYNFSKSPVICEVETDNYLTSGDFGDKAKLVFYVPPNPVDGNEFKIDTGVISLWYYFTNGINPLKWVVPLRAGGLTDAEYYQIVLTNLQANPGIGTYYTITYVGSGGFLFEAVAPGNTYSNVGSTVNGTGFSFTNLKNGTSNFLTNVPRPNYKLAIDLYIETAINTGVWKFLLQASKEPINNRVKFNLSDHLNSHLNVKFPSSYMGGTPFLCSETCKRFFVIYKEIYGEPPVNQTFTIGPSGAMDPDNPTHSYISYILKAAFSQINNRILPSNQLSNYVWGNPSFLSTYPKERDVRIQQPEYLYMCLDRTYIQLRLKLETTLEDGTIVTDLLPAVPINYAKGSVICFPVNYSGSAMYNKLNAGTATKFSVYAIENADPDTPVSDIIIYYPKYETLKEQKVILYDNSLGGVDTFVFKNHEFTSEFDSEYSSRFYYTDDATNLGEEIQTNVSKKDVVKVYSGFLSQDKMAALDDFFLSKHKVLYDFNKNLFIPIKVKSAKVSKHKSNRNLNYCEFEYVHSYENKAGESLHWVL
jgi:hypothetical protein